MIRKVVFAIAVLCFVGASADRAASLIARADADSFVSQEYQIKAAFLFNFGKFVEWPASASDVTTGNFVIGIYGSDPFGDDIDQLMKDERIQQMPIVVRRFTDMKTLDACHILFINLENPQKLRELIDFLDSKSILTVGQNPGFIENGGMITLLVENDQIRFEINKNAIDKSGLFVSSQLLKLARAVKGQ